MLRSFSGLVSAGEKKLPASPAFPGGIPAALGASVVLNPLSDVSDSEYGPSALPCSFVAHNVTRRRFRVFNEDMHLPI